MGKSSLLRMGDARCAQARLMVSEGATSVGLRKQPPFATPPLVSLRNDVLGIGTSAEIPHWWRMGSVVSDLWEVAALQNVSYFLRLLTTQLTKLITLISYPDLTLSLLAARELGTKLILKIGEMKLSACYAIILFPLFVSACSLIVTKRISVRSQEHWTVQKKTDEKKRAEKMC